MACGLHEDKEKASQVRPVETAALLVRLPRIAALPGNIEELV